MPKIVVKFGGSNLRSKDEIHRIIQVVKNYNQPLVIVVSAFYGVTNYLLNALEKARHDEEVAEKTVQHLFELKIDSINHFISDEALRTETIGLIQNQLDELKKYLHGIALTGDASKALEDHLLSYGERLSAIFLNSILLSQGTSSPKRKLPRINRPFYRWRIWECLSRFSFVYKSSVRDSSERRSDIMFVPGFYGVSKDQKTTLFGRGGSDYAAAALARCVGACITGYLERCQRISEFRSETG